MFIRLVVLILSSLLSIGLGARFNVVGSTNEQQFIRLKSQYDMKPGTVLKLPIDVPQEYISLFGTLPPRLISITSPNSNGVYGTGDVIYIELKFTIEVLVSGTPTLTVNTGCHTASCATNEVQSFFCAADSGMLGLRMEDQFIMNIDANTTHEQFKTRLQTLSGINNVTVKYNDTNDRVYSEGNRICTSLGKNISITFNSVSFPQYNGDVPPFVLSSRNYFPDPRSGQDVGDGTVLKGSYPEYDPLVTPSVELVKGNQQRDGTAYYFSGNGTNVVTFKFVASNGDFTDDLEVLSMSFDNGYIYSPFTGANVSTSVPAIGAGPRYMSIAASALGYHSDLSVTSAQPQIIEVTSPKPDGTYTQGDRIIVQVLFNLPIKLEAPHQFTLQLSTGSFDRQIPFYALVNDTVLEFLYTVQQGDISARLDTKSSRSLDVGNGNIYRKTSTNETIANTTLPFPGSSGSLSVNKNLVINTQSPQIISSSVISPPGVYTGGDDIYIQVQYEDQIRVSGNPRLLISNAPQPLKVNIRTAPFGPLFTYSRAYPSQDAQIQLSFTLNYDLFADDEIVVHLPGFDVHDTAKDVNRSLSITPISGLKYPSSIHGTWNEYKQSIYLTLNETLLRNTELSLQVNGRTGIFVPADGVLLGDPSIKFDLVTSAVNRDVTRGYSFASVAPVGFSNISLTLSPALVSSAQTVTLDFTVPEALAVGDNLRLYFPGFSTSASANYSFTMSQNPYFEFHWDGTINEFKIHVMDNSTQLTHSVEITHNVPFYLPSTGVKADTITLSGSLVNNGEFDGILLPYVTKVCAVMSADVEYKTKSAGATSAVVFSWSVGPTDMEVGDKIVVTLPAYDVSVGAASRSIPNVYVSGSDSFTVSIKQAVVTFTCIESVAAYENVEIQLSALAQLIVPTTGIRPTLDSFDIQVVSSQCAMSGVESLLFSESSYIMSVVAPSIYFTPSTLVAGQKTEMDIQFSLYHDLYEGDYFHVTIPGFTRYIEVDPYNRSILSNANVSMRFNRLLERLEFVLLSDFLTPLNTYTSATPLHVQVNRSELFALPMTGFSSSSFVLSVFSPTVGQMTDQVMSSPCLGVCTGSVDYSTVFDGEDVTVTFTVSLSHNVSVLQHLQIFMDGFLLPSSSSVATVFTLQSTSQTATSSWRGGNSTLFVVLPKAVTAHKSFTLAVSGLQFASNLTVGQPVLSFVDSSIGGTAQFSFDAPTVLPQRRLKYSRMFFGASGSNSTTVIELLLDLPDGDIMSAGDYLEIKLTDFTNVNPAGVTVVSFSSSPSVFDTESSQWSPSSHILQLVLKRKWFSNETLSVFVNDFQVPKTGVSSSFSNTPTASPTIGPSSSASTTDTPISYSLAVRDSSSEIQYVSAFQQFSYIEEVVRISAVSVDLAFTARQPVNLTTITVSLTINSDLQAGDVFQVTVPNLVHNSGTVHAASTIDSSVSFSSRNSTLKFVVDLAAPAGQVVFVVNASSSALFLTQTGIVSGTYATVRFYRSYYPSVMPTMYPSALPTIRPSMRPSLAPSAHPSVHPSLLPTLSPSTSVHPSTVHPSMSPTTSNSPSIAPTTSNPSVVPSDSPTHAPSVAPSCRPSQSPSVGPTFAPSTSQHPSLHPTVGPSKSPSVSPSQSPTYEIIDNVYTVILSEQVLLPCAGLCGVDIVPEVRRAGYPTSYSLSLTFGELKYANNDIISLHLPGFTTRLANATVNVTGVSTSGISRTVEVSFLPDYSLLTLQTVGNASGVSDFTFTLPQTFGMSLPKIGIRQDTKFEANLTSVIGHHNQQFYSPAVTVAPVGTAISSNFILKSPRVPNSIVNAYFHFEFENDMSAGDYILIYLPDFVVPSGSLSKSNTSYSLSVVGVDSSTSEVVNPDNSAMLIHHTANVVVTLNVDVPAGQNVSFGIQTISGVYLPNNGVYRNTSPKYAVLSATNPIATTSFLSFTGVGSLSPAHLVSPTYRYDGGTLVPGVVEVVMNFAVNCPLFFGDEIEVFLPNLKQEHLLAYVNVSSNTGVFNATWNNATSFLTLAVADNSYVLSGILSLGLSLHNFEITDQIVYANDSNCKFKVHSSQCPVDLMSFESSTASLVEYASVSFSETPYPSKVSPVTLTLVPTVDLNAGDILTLILPGFYHNLNVTNTSIAITTGLVSWLDNTAHIVDKSTALYLRVNVTSVVSAYTAVFFTTSSDKHGLTIPSTGVEAINSGIRIELKRGSEVVFKGLIENVQPVAYFIKKNIDILHQVSGEASSFVFQWQVSRILTIGEQVTFHLPGFSRSTSGSLTFNGSASTYFGGQWDASSSSVVFTVLHTVPDAIVMSADVYLSNQLKTPVVGFPDAAYTYSVSLLDTSDTVVLVESMDSSINVVPYIVDASIVFISSNVNDSVVYGGDAHIMQLQPGHELTPLDIGAQIVIDGFFYYIKDVQQDLLYLVEPFQGNKIFMGLPETFIYTPPFRYAYYHNGSDTNNLVYRYRVRRGDLSLNVSVFNPFQGSFGNLNSTLNYDLNGGTLLRFSDDPAVLASVALPSLEIGDGRHVNTETPQIVKFYTTSDSGVYSIGQKLDFQVQYDVPVVMNLGPYSSPRLLLQVAPFGRVTAFYASGDGSDTLVFVYTVKLVDDQSNLNSSILSVDYPIFQPLRILTNNHMTNLSRNAVEPLIHAHLEFLNTTEISIPDSLTVIGRATKVINIWATASSRHGDLYFTAGDVVQVHVVFSHGVTFNISTDSKPHILLVSGQSTPAIAYYTSQYNQSTLTFEYIVSVHDHLEDGLYLYSTKVDYFNRTSIVLNGSLIQSIEGIPASVILANSSQPTDLLIEKWFYIDNTVPTVSSIRSNLSSILNIHPNSVGDVALVSIAFTSRVSVQGVIKLWMRGSSTQCPARYFAGNNTNVLEFVYVMTYQSGVSRMDCTSVSALDTSTGTILRLSDSPQITANTNLPRPGIQSSLGLQSDIVIDTTPITIESLSIYEDFRSEDPYLATDTLGLNLLKYSENGVFKYDLQGRPELNMNSTQSLSKSLLNSLYDYPLDLILNEFSVADGSPNYTRVIVADQHGDAFRFSPLAENIFEGKAGYTVNNGYWWTGYNIRSQVEIDVGFSRPVNHGAVSLPLNTGLALNRAHSVTQYHSYILNVTFGNDVLVQESYRIEYAGYQTECISVKADSASVSSVLNALEGLPSVKALEPNVVMLQSDETSASYLITYSYLPNHPFHVLTASQLGGSCDQPASSDQVVLTKSRMNVVFTYNIHQRSSILLTAAQNVTAGHYSLTLNAFNGVEISDEGLKTDSIWLEQYRPDGKLIAKTLISVDPVPRITRSSLSFGSSVPESLTSIHVDICVDGLLSIDNSVDVYLHGFNTSANSLLNVNMTTSKFTVIWRDSTSSLFFNITHPTSCVYADLGSSYGFHLPPSVDFENEHRSHFTLVSKNVGSVTAKPFATTSAVGLGKFGLSFSDVRPNYPSEMYVVFSVVADSWLTSESELIITMPTGFRMMNNFSDRCLVSGPFAQFFEAKWHNLSSTIHIHPLSTLSAGLYNLTLGGKSEDFAFTLPFSGMFTYRSPSLNVTHSEKYSYVKVLSDFPHVCGYDEHTALTLVVTTGTYALTDLTFDLSLDRQVSGPATITLSMPCVTNSMGYYILGNQSNFDSVTWSEENKVFTFYRQSGWFGVVSLQLSGLTNFIINEVGIPYLTEFGVGFGIEGSDGSLPLSRIASVTSIPVIQYSSMSFSMLADDVFTTKPLSVSIHLKLSIRAVFNQVFVFNIPGMEQINASDAKINDRCAYLNQTTAYALAVTISNVSDCVHQTREFFWEIQLKKPQPVETRQITQYNSGAYSVEWQNDYFNSGFQTMTEPPAVGITYCAVDLSNPHSGEKSVVTVRVLTATKLIADDKIVLKLHDFGFNWTSAEVSDNFKNTWTVEVDSVAETISFAAPTTIRPSALKFVIGSHLATTVPFSGIVAEPSSNYTVTLARGSTSLVPQNILQITPVGFVQELVFKPTEILTYASAGSSVLISDTSFAVSLTTLSALHAGDVITLHLPHYTFVYNEVLKLDEDSALLYKGKVVAASQTIQVTLLTNQESQAISFNILASDSIKTSTTSCGSSCSVSIAVDSRSNPVRSQSFLSSGSFFVSNTPTIGFYMTTLSPTFFPTFPPSEAPTAEVLFNYTNDPAMVPTSQPSSRPSNLPTSQPSGSPTSQPSMVPTVRMTTPTFLPTLRPSTAFVSAFLASDLSFTLANDLSAGDQVDIVVPSLYTDATPGIMWVDQTSPGDVADWQVRFYEANKTISLVALVTIASGSHSMTIGSTDVQITNSILNGTTNYLNNPAVTFQIVSADGYVSQSGNFHLVHSFGLRTSSLSFGTVIPGSETSMSLSFSVRGKFAIGDYVFVYLPGFTKDNSSHLHLEGSSALSVTGSWTSSTHTLKFSMNTDTLSAVHLTVPLINGFRIPPQGCNAYNDLPTITYVIDVSDHIFGPVAFNVFTPVSHSSFANFTFSNPLAGQASTMSLALGTNLYLNAYDVLDFYLPEFWSTERDVTVSSTMESFSAEWIPCSETLRLHSLADVLVAQDTLTIDGLRLPLTGVSPYLTTLFRFSSNSTEAGVISMREVTMDTVGYFTRSSISFTPTMIGENTNILLNFAANLDLAVGDEIQIYLPGFTFSSASPTVVNNDSFYSAAWSSGSSLLTLSSSVEVSAFHVSDVEITGGIKLPSVGFPGDKQYYLKMTSVNGNIGTTPFLSYQSLGVLSASVYYDAIDAGKEIGLRLQFQLSHSMVPNDYVTFHLPVVNSTWRDSILQLTSTGDLAEEGFVSGFNATFDNNAQELRLTAVTTLLPRVFNVFIGMDNQLVFSVHSTGYLLSHHVSANVSGLGMVAERVIQHFPTRLFAASDGHVTISNCTAKIGCDLAISLHLASTVDVGDVFALSHANFKRLNHAHARMSNWPASAQFSSSWRDADNVDQLKTSSLSIDSFEGYLNAVSDFMHGNSVNLSLPETEISMSTIVSNIPHVIGVKVLSAYAELVCLDSVQIVVTFSEPVLVYPPLDVKLLLSTQEYAKYKSGSGTSEITFVYIVEKPLVVSDLSILGPGAMEYYNPSLITRVDSKLIVANISIPPPYNELMFADGHYQAISVNCGLTTTVADVTAISKTFTTYATGDVLDVAVNFERAVSVSGQPHLILQDRNLTSEFVAKYVNVSYVQWVESYQSGYFALSYNGSMTGCINVNDSDALFNEITALEDLQYSLPLVIVPYALSNGYRYKLDFTGPLAPFVFTVVPLACDLEAATTVQVDSTMLTKAVFRYTVVDGDEAPIVTYHNSSGIKFNSSNDLIYLAGKSKSTVVDSALPPIAWSNALMATSRIRFHTVAPHAYSVYSNFTGTADSGDSIFIVVNYSAPVTVVGNVYLQLNFSEVYLLSTDFVNATYFLRNASYNTYHRNQLIFRYDVQVGDHAHYLNNVDTLLVDGSIKLTSMVPTTDALLTLPSHFDSSALYSSHVFVNGSNEPSIYNVWTNHSHGLVNAGEEIFIFVRFSSNVTVLPTDSHDPSIFVSLASPTDGYMNYSSGSGTTDLVFLYMPVLGQNTTLISFMFELNGAKLRDNLNHRFSYLSKSRSEVYRIHGLKISTKPAVVLRINATCPDGTYYPGDTLDLYVTFDKPVIVVGANVPRMELFVPYQSGEDLLATYAYGNGTEEIHFLYTIPPPNTFLLRQSPEYLDYGGIACLLSHLNGSVFLDVSTHSSTEANVLLPVLDHSNLFFDRLIKIDFNVASVVSVFSTNASGIYTAGDKLTIGVEFSRPVMVFRPPVLKLYTGSTNRSAIYSAGNYTSTLYFVYTVKEGDTAKRLDYIDTSYAPYKTISPTFTLALNSDTTSSPLLQMDQVTSILPYATKLNGIFMASEYSLIAAYAALPLPGEEGSLSYNSNIVIDTTAPYVTKVTSPLPDGTYGVDVIIPVYVQFSAPVVVGGCPRLTFRVGTIDRFAEYISGSGSNKLLFEFIVRVTDAMTEFDYFDRNSLKLYYCSEVRSASIQSDLAEIYILRASQDPVIFASLTLPTVKIVETVISPVSVVGSGRNLTLAGSTFAPRVIWSPQDNSRSYSLGDVIDINIGFSGPINFPSNAYVNTDDYTRANKTRPVYVTQQVNSTTVLFSYVVQVSESVGWLTYPDQFSLLTSSACAITEVGTGSCVSQGIPEPFSMQINSLDSLSLKELVVTSDTIVVESLSFKGVSNASTNSFDGFYNSGSIVTISVVFSEAVVVYGHPTINFRLDGAVFPSIFDHQASDYELIFIANIEDDAHHGSLLCSHDSVIDLNGGSIFRKVNFLPLTAVDLKINDICCMDANCMLETPVYQNVPVVVQVYSNQTGVFSTGEEILIFVEFSSSVAVIGAPVLVLDLVGQPTAAFLEMYDDHTLLFRYVAKVNDFTSSLDYFDSNSLLLKAPSATLGPYDGIFLDNIVGRIVANVSLATRGGLGSLGRTSDLIINKDRPNLIGTSSAPTQATSGDDVVIKFEYSETMVAVDSFGVSLLSSDSSSTSSLVLNLIIKPLGSTTILKRVARLLSVSGTTVSFVYQVTGTDPSGSIYFASAAPLTFTNAYVKSATSGTDGPTKLLTSTVSKALATIDNNIPVVLSVYSPNVTVNYAFGGGDVIDIFVEMSLNCVIYTAPTLALSLTNRDDAVAYYYAAPGTDLKTTAVKILHFKYVIEDGDTANPLEYQDEFSLNGFLLRFSSRNPAIVADLTLPAPFGLGSLGYCCNVRIDSSEPYIESLIPLKRIGIYGENETILIVARFNKPVVVKGVPKLELDTGTNRVGIAYYTTDYAQYTDIPIDIQSTDVVFQYNVQRYDNVLSLHHSDTNALQLHNGSAILLLTNDASTPADVSLLDPTDFSLTNGLIVKQWKFRYPKTVELLFRDLYHTKVDSLSVSMEHIGKSSNIFSGSQSGKIFGNNYPKTRLGTDVSVQASDTGIGSDFLFSDLVAPNIALQSSATQSSTRLSADRAIDGNVDPLIGDLSVSETSEETNAWWQLALPQESIVRSINIWVREPQDWIDPIIEFTMKGLEAYPKGFFQLHFSNIDGSSSSVTGITSKIPMGIEGEDLQKIIEAVSGLGNVGVTRRTLPQCSSLGHGCGEGSEHGLGHVYRLDFQSLRVASPVVKIVNIRFVGQDNTVTSLAGNYELPENVQFFQLSTHVNVIRTGYYIQVADVPTYGYGVDAPKITAVKGFNEWLSPFWVTIHTSTSKPPSDLNATVNNSVWYQRYEIVNNLLTIVLKEPIVGATYLKIQKEGYGSLSLAEVQVYSEKLNTLDAYSGGSPIYPSYLTNPYQPSGPFAQTFGSVPFDGRWLVLLSQDNSTGSTLQGGNAALGTLSEVVLVITDLAGIVHAYYQDLRAQVIALPKYGDLSYTISSTPHPYGDWREAFEVSSQGQLQARDGLQRLLGYCYGTGVDGRDAYENCPNNFGVGPLLNNRVLGDTAEQYFLRGERVVVYQPKVNYIGPDYFTYIIYDGLNTQSHEYLGGISSSNNEVTIHVRNCRRFQSEERNEETTSIHPICTCAQSETGIISNRTGCDAVRTTLCNGEETRDKFLTMCLTCIDTVDGLITGDCQLQTIRAVSLMTSRGLCETSPPMDCSTESVTSPGKEQVNYLTLKPPFLYGAFTKLKNRFGAYGWYHTPMLT